MKVSGIGAVVGALIGCVGRASVVLLNILGHGGGAQGPIAAFVLPSAAIGLLIGAMAGAVGKPLLGAVVGAVLSGLVFELFMCACSSLIGSFSPQAGEKFFTQTLIYGLEMAVAGALAGGIGGWVGKMRDDSTPPSTPGLPPSSTGETPQAPRTAEGNPSDGIRKVDDRLK